MEIIITDDCIRCGKCVKKCNHGTLKLGEKVAEVADLTLCKGCKKCETVCPKNAIYIKLSEAEKIRREKKKKLKQNVKISGIIILILIIIILIMCT